MPEVTFQPAHEIFTPRAGVVAARPRRPSPGPATWTSSEAATRRSPPVTSPAVLALFDADLVWSTVDSVRFGGVYHGPEGAGEFFTKLPQN